MTVALPRLQTPNPTPTWAGAGSAVRPQERPGLPSPAVDGEWVFTPPPPVWYSQGSDLRVESANASRTRQLVDPPLRMHLVNGTGNSPVSGTADPRSSQTGHVIRGLR